MTFLVPLETISEYAFREKKAGNTFALSNVTLRAGAVPAEVTAHVPSLYPSPGGEETGRTLR